MPEIGLLLPPDPVALTLLWPLIRHELDYYAVTPQTLWGRGFRDLFLRLKDQTGRPFVGHGVGLSPASPPGPQRTAWLERITRDAADFEFAWFTDHLGWTEIDGQQLHLPLAAPDTPRVRAHMVHALGQLAEIIPLVGLENSVFYCSPGAPLDEPTMLGEVLAQADAWLLLDLHNLWTHAQNLGFDPLSWLERAPLSRVIEIHISGGQASPAGWLPQGRQLHLDSHDTAVPEPVWELLTAVLDRCPALRGVTLERMEGTVQTDDIAPIGRELRRLRALL